MNFFVDFESVANVALLLIPGRNFFVDDDAEVSGVELREEGVAIEVGGNLGQVDPVKQVRSHRRLIDLRSADDPSGLTDVSFGG